MTHKPTLLAQAFFATSEGYAHVEQWQQNHGELLAQYENFLQLMNHNEAMAFHGTDHTHAVAGQTFAAILNYQTDPSPENAAALVTHLKEDKLIPQDADIGTFHDQAETLTQSAAVRYIAGIEHDMLQQSMMMVQLLEDMGVVARPDAIGDRNTSKVRIRDHDAFEQFMHNPIGSMSAHVQHMDDAGQLSPHARQMLDASIEAMASLGPACMKAPLEALQTLDAILPPYQEDAKFQPWIAYETWSHTTADFLHDSFEMSADHRIATQLQTEATRPFMGADAPFNLMLLAEKRYEALGTPLDLASFKQDFQTQQRAFVHALEARTGLDLNVLHSKVNDGQPLLPLDFADFSQGAPAPLIPRDLMGQEQLTRMLLEASTLPDSMLDSQDPQTQKLVSMIGEAMQLGAIDRQNFNLPEGEREKFHEETKNLVIENRLGGVDMEKRQKGGVDKDDLIEGFQQSAGGMGFLSAFGIETWAIQSADVDAACTRNANFREIAAESVEQSQCIVDKLNDITPNHGTLTTEPKTLQVEMAELIEQAEQHCRA
jgi:hypothetical protein